MYKRILPAWRALGTACAALVLLACSGRAEAQYNQWSFGTTLTEVGHRMAVVPSGGTIVCGQVSVTRQDAAGNVQWMFMMDRVYPYAVIPTSDGGFAVAGLYLVDEFERQTILIKLSAAGAPDWHHLYPGTHESEYCDLIQTADDGFLIAVDLRDPDGLLWLPFLIKTKPNGSPQWMHRYKPVSFSSPGGEFTRVQEDVDSDGVSSYNLTGYIGEFPQGKSDTLLMRVAADGSVVTANTIGFDVHNDRGRGLVRESDMSFLVSGYSKELGEGGGTFLMRVDNNFALDWYIGIYGFTGTKEILLTATGEASLGGTTTYPNPVDNAGLVTIDLATKTLAWGMQYGGASSERGDSVALNPNGYDIFGSTKSFEVYPGTQDFYLVKADPLGRSGCNESAYDPQIIPGLPPERGVEFEVLDLGPVPQREIDWSYVEYREEELCEGPDPCLCVDPPEGMTAWWTFDELVGPVAPESVAGNDGVHVADAVPVPGKVENGIGLDGAGDYVEVPSGPTINVPEAIQGTAYGNFTIDAWIRIDSMDSMTIGPILEKRDVNGGPGYAFYIRDGRLHLDLSDGLMTATFQSVQILPQGVFTHVAVIVDRTVNYNVRFMVDGVDDLDPTPMTVLGSLSNTVPLWIGAMRYVSVPGSPGAFFKGVIDEVEFFERVLDTSEIQAIYNAGECGKCKFYCHAPWDIPYCEDDLKVVADITVCNTSPNPSVIELDFEPINPPECGSIDGPTGFTVLSPGNPVTIPGNSCVVVEVSIDRPVDMVNLFDLGCFRVTLTNLDNGNTNECTGSVIYRPDLCPGYVGPAGSDFAELVPGIDFEIDIDIENTGLDEEVFVWRGVVYDDAMGVSRNIGVNGIDPGEYAVGKMAIALGDTKRLGFSLRAIDFEGLSTSDFVLLTMQDSVAVPLISIPLRTVLDDSSCPGDFNNDGVVDGADLASVLGAWGECIGCAEDLNGDDVVDGADLATMLGSWGPCQ